MLTKLNYSSIVLYALVLFVTNANASPQISGAITEVWVNDGSNSNVIYVSTATAYSSSCGPASRYFVMDLTEAGMKEAYAMALSAYMIGKNVTMQGSGVCYGPYEKLKYIYLSG
jgi:hypothetical protein